MSSDNTYLAVFLANRHGSRRKAWDALAEPERRAKEQQGMAAWKAWMDLHQASVAYLGGPLGKTKKIDERGIEAAGNEMAAFIVVRAASEDAATKMFERHPHFTVFPGDRVEIMPVLSIPGA